MTRPLRLLLLLLCSASLVQAQHHYKVTNLGILPGETLTVGFGLNDHGDVVGSCAVPDPTSFSDFKNEHPFVYHAGKLTDFAPNGFYNYSTGRATGINNAGLICGYFYGPYGPPITPIQSQQFMELAFVYNGNLKPITDGHHRSTASAINNANEMVGSYTPVYQTISISLTNYLDHPFTFVNNPQGWGTFKDVYVADALDPYPKFGSSQAFAINDREQVAGASSLAAVANGNGFTPEAWLYTNGTAHFLRSDVTWNALAINNHATAVGSSSGQFQHHGFPNNLAVIYENGVLSLLTFLSPTVQSIYSSSPASIANGINDAGQIVGSVGFTSSIEYTTTEGRAVLWLGNKVYDLNTLAVAPGVMLTDAVAINQGGQILCNGTLNEAKRAFLLTPQ